MKRESYKSAAIICGAADANGYGIIRSLAKSGVPVIALDDKRRALGLYSRHCKGIVCPSPKVASGEKFVDFLINLGSKMKHKAVLFPYREDIQLVVLKNWDRLNSYYLLPMSDLKHAEIIADKDKFAKALEKMDIPYPNTYYPDDDKMLKDIADKFDYPCIVKPTKSMEFGKEFGIKVFKAESRQELLDYYHRTVNSGYKAIIQEIVPGEDSELFTF